MFLIFPVACPDLTNPSNGMLTCSFGGDSVAYNGETCDYTCDTGYILSGSATRSCQGNGAWTGAEVICNRGKMYSNVLHFN